MGGKGKRRREKNYKAAHGENTRLPPPPVLSSLDAIPFKLRQLLALTSQVHKGKNTTTVTDSANKPRSEADIKRKRNEIEKEDSNVGPAVQNTNSDDVDVHDDADQKKRKKQKKSQAKDLRFAAEMEKMGIHSISRRERKKEYFKAKKKKNKKASVEDNLYAPKKDVVQFGDIVQEPPDLHKWRPKAPKKPLDASQERIRLQAVEAYRSRRQWASRPGVHLPPHVEE